MATTQEDNVKVAVRVRPLLAKEKLGGEQVCVRLVPHSNQVVVGKDRAFTFDYALSPKISQEATYKQCVEPLVRSIFEGYNSTVFAYGQTGSGKTYTIGGGDTSSLTEEEYGVIPRALTQMFDIMKANDHVTYDVRVSYVEIYKEELRDLLDLDTPSKDLHVREDDKGNTVVVGAREERMSSLDEVMSLLEAGSAARHTGSTQMNEHSSRSHSVFSVLIGQQWSEADAMAERRVHNSSEETADDIPHYMCGKFHFVDLAGSERAHRTGNVGDRFKESIHINSGLLSLGNVISSLGDPKKKSHHIPYRDSKITRILKDSLGGNAKTVMICCISPATSNFDESLNALKYANRARNIQNKPIINRDIQSIRFEEMQSEIMALREELARQRTGVQSAFSENGSEHSATHIKDLELKINRLETECAHYRMIAQEAFKQLTDIQGRDLLSTSLDVRLRDWLELMEEIKNKVPATLSREDLQNETIRNLQSQLNKCRSDLKSDEEIFADKTREVKQLTECLQEMEQCAAEGSATLSEFQTKVEQQQQQLVQQQLRIQQLEAAIKASALSDSSVMDSATLLSSSGPPSSLQRPKSVPAHLHSTPQNGGRMLRPPSRHVKTSPALFSVNRVMQSFRARSQLLATRLEDGDEVLHQTFSDDSGGEDDEDIMPGEGALQRRGTYRVKKTPGPPRVATPQPATPSTHIVTDREQQGDVRSSTHTVETIEETEGGSRLINVEVTNSTEVQRKKIKQAQLKILEANQKVRDLSINIRMKEQLICELVKTGKDAQLMNKQYAEKIKALEKEKEHARQDVVDVQVALQELEAKEQQETAEKHKLQQDYRKKMEAAKQKVTALQRRQKETEKVATFAHQHEKKIHDLESQVDRMKQQQETLHKKLKEEGEQKSKLEREMQKELQRVKDLELRNEHQQKVLKRKTEEIAAVQRRLRSAPPSSTSNSNAPPSTTSLPPISGEDVDKMDDQRRHLDAEIERVLAERQKMVELQEELKRREAIVAKKEAMLTEKSELEIKKMRSSTLLNKERQQVSARLGSIEGQLEERCQEQSQLPAEQRHLLREEISQLRLKRDRLQQEREVIDGKLHDGIMLSPQQERRLIELEEGMEALDAAIQYKNDSIHSKQSELRQSQTLGRSEDNLMHRLSSLSATETRSMLSRYFDKVIDLREGERRLKLQCSEMEVKAEEMERVVHQLESALQKSAFELDRRLTQQQQEHEKKIHLLMHQLMMTEGASSSGGGGGGRPTAAVPNGDISLNNNTKLHQLEKELYFYKKTSRELKKKVREMFNTGKLPAQVVEDLGVSLVSNSVQSLAADGEPGNTPTPTPRSSLNFAAGPAPRGSTASLRSHHFPPSSSAQPAPPLSSPPASTTPTPRHRTSSQDPSALPSAPSAGVAGGGGVTPVKMSRKDLRVMSAEEVSLRRSNMSGSRASVTSPQPKDGSRNPWDS